MLKLIEIIFFGLILGSLSCQPNGAHEIPESSSFPPNYDGYFVHKIVGYPDRADKIQNSIGVPPNAIFTLTVNSVHSRIDSGDDGLLVVTYQNHLGEITGAFVYQKVPQRKNEKSIDNGIRQ